MAYCTPYSYLYLAIISCSLLTSTSVLAEVTDIAPTRITTVSVQSLVFFPSRNAPASTQAINHSKVPAQIGALVQSISVRVGDKVNQGQQLALLDCRDVTLNVSAQQAQLLQLKTNYQFQKRQLKRGNNLAKRKTIGEVELDKINTGVLTARAQLSAQKSQLDQALLNKGRCQIRAPFDGMVSKRLANVGEMIDKGRPVIELIELNNVEVTANVALGDTQSYNQAKSFYFESSAQQYPLVNRILLPLVLDKTRSRQARLNFSAIAAMPGLTGRLFWLSATPHLPAHILQLRNGSYGVFVVVNDQVKFIAIETAQEGRPIPIVDGEQWSDYPLVIDGRHGLVDGQKVAVIAIKSAQTQEELALSITTGAQQ